MAHDNNTTPLYFNENQALTPGALAQLPSDTLLDQNVSQKITGNIFKFSLTGKKHPPVKLFGADNNNETGSKIAVLTMTVSFSGRILGLFDVYLNLPPGATPDTKGNYFAGFMSFFGSTGVHQFPVEKNTGAGNKKQTKTFYFDMTDEFMATKALEKNEFEITIIRHNTNRNEDITVERVTITTQMP